MEIILQQNLMKNLPLSASGRLRAYFSTKLYKIPFYRPSADWGLIFNKIKRKIRNLLISAFGRFEAHFPTKLNAKYKMSLYRPPADWGLFFHKIRLKYKIPCHRPSADSELILQQNFIKKPFHRPSADLKIILQQNLIKNLPLSASGRLRAYFSTKLDKTSKIPFNQPPADWGLIFQQNLI